MASKGFLGRLGLVRKGQVKVSQDVAPQIGSEASLELAQIIAHARQVNQNRKDRLEDAQTMSQDSLIMSAAELYADDATMVDSIRNHAVWVEGDDKKLVDELNDWLVNVVKIDENLWTWAYDIVLWGEVYLKTYYSELKDSKPFLVTRYFEKEPDISKISHIFSMGKEQGYLYSEEEDAPTLFSPRDYIHFYSRKSTAEEDIEIEKIGADGEPVSRKYRVAYGTSLFESAREAHKVMNMIELMLLSARLTRSPAFRLVQMEVGNASAKEAQNILAEVRKAFKYSERMNVNSKDYSSVNSPVPVNDFIFATMRGGKGQITVSDVGGSFDVKDIMDVEHFRNKLYAALKVPKIYLGVDEALPGGIGDTSLTRIDARYARSVKRLQEVLKSGVTDLVKFYMSIKGLKGEVEISMANVATAEDQQSLTDLSMKLDAANSLKDFADSLEGVSNHEKRAIYKYIFDDVLKIPGLFTLPDSFGEDPDAEDTDRPAPRSFGGPPSRSDLTPPPEPMDEPDVSPEPMDVDNEMTPPPEEP